MAKSARRKTSAKKTAGARKAGGARKAAGARKAGARKAAGAKKTGGAKKAGGARKSGGRQPNAAFMRPVTPSSQLAEIVGAQPIPRTEVTKRLWAYIKRNKLQDANNKRMIKADASLKPVFRGKSTVNMFEMTKLVNNHLS